MSRYHLAALGILIAILGSSALCGAAAPTCAAQTCVYLPIARAPETVPVTLLPDGDFEPPSLWQGNPIDIVAGAPSNPQLPPAHSGEWLAWIREGAGAAAGLGQQISVPPGTPFLSYWYRIESTEPTCGADRAIVKVWPYPGAKLVTVDQFDLCTATQTQGWTNRIVDLHEFTVVEPILWFSAESSNGLSDSNWFIDDVGLRERP